MAETQPTSTIDDLLPPCFEKQPNGDYKVTGVVAQVQAENGFAFAIASNASPPETSSFFVFYEDARAVQSEEWRVNAAFYACGMRASKENKSTATFIGELLPKNYAKWEIKGKPYRGLRLKTMSW